MDRNNNMMLVITQWLFISSKFWGLLIIPAFLLKLFWIYKIYFVQIDFNPTLYRGTEVLVSGAFQSDLRDPKCWHNSYMIMRIDFMKKKFQNFFKIFFNFFQFFGHPSHTKRFFCTFGPKITYSYILGGQHVHLTPKKCFLEAHSTKCPWNAPPRKYPDISEPVQGRVKGLKPTP